MSEGELEKRMLACLSEENCSLEDRKGCLSSDIDEAKKELELHSTDIPKTFFPNLKHYVLIDRATWKNWFGDSS